MLQFSTLPPLSLYVHMPWCEKKCPYCDFNSHERRDGSEAEYIDALLMDLEEDLPRIWGRRIVSVFIGGGTPSLFSPESMDRLLSGLRARLNLAVDIEVTMEANPSSAEAEKFSELRSAGINRLSIGVQSFHDDALQRLGRVHGRKQAIKAAEMAHDAGFDNFNLDLMFGLPGQNIKMAAEDLNTAISLEPTHLSYYQLTMEPNTWFYRHPPVLPDDDLIMTIHDQGQQLLGGSGYGQYEISGYAQQGRECQHNLNYWRFGDYLGIGAGAHAKISSAQAQSVSRISKKRQPDDYLSAMNDRAFISTEQLLAKPELISEFMMNALRLNDGFDSELFTQHTGMPISVVEKLLFRCEERGLLEWGVKKIRPTEQGKRYLNELLLMFLD